MKNLRNLRLVATGCALAAMTLLLAAQAQEPKPQPAKITGHTLMPVDQLKWTPMPGLEGAQQATLWGDPTKEAHRVFYKWRAGLKAPEHAHTHGDRGVIISGALSIAVEGAPPKKLPAGSYFSLAGGIKHSTAVDGDTPCVFYIEREGPFDAIMVAEASGPKKQ
jgi:anti-sigma factor ChrR (cupin superfamily)